MIPTQVRNAKYKGPRLVEPKQDSSKYCVIDEVISLADYSLNTSIVGPNTTDNREFKFTCAQFLSGSALMQAFMGNFKQFRCRKVEVTLESSMCGTEHFRLDQCIYWIPNHFEFDNDASTIPSNWNAVLEMDHISTVTRSGGRNIVKMAYIPQMVSYDEIDEDEDEKAPDSIFQIRGDFQSGWLPTGAPYTTLEYRGPLLIHRIPYHTTVQPVCFYAVNVRTIWEFRNAKADV